MLRRARAWRIYSEFDPAVIWRYIWLHNLGSGKRRRLSTVLSSASALAGVLRGAGEAAEGPLAGSFSSDGPVSPPPAPQLQQVPVFADGWSTRHGCRTSARPWPWPCVGGRAVQPPLLPTAAGAAVSPAGQGAVPLLLKMPSRQALVGSWSKNRRHNPQDRMAFVT